jgi:hypothetical protein
MPVPRPDDDNPEPSALSDPPGGPATSQPVTMTLEDIVDMTGEMEHLSALVGLSTPEAYFAAVHPLLDLLEVEIRVRCRKGMCRDEMKLIVQDWIDGEIRELRSHVRRT